MGRETGVLLHKKDKISDQQQTDIHSFYNYATLTGILILKMKVISAVRS